MPDTKEFNNVLPRRAFFGLCFDFLLLWLLIWGFQKAAYLPRHVSGLASVCFSLSCAGGVELGLCLSGLYNHRVSPRRPGPKKLLLAFLLASVIVSPVIVSFRPVPSEPFRVLMGFYGLAIPCCFLALLLIRIASTKLLEGPLYATGRVVGPVRRIAQWTGAATLDPAPGASGTSGTGEIPATNGTNGVHGAHGSNGEVKAVVDPESGFSSAAERLFNLLLATFLIILASPVYLAMVLVVYAVAGRPIFYKGTRLGLDKKLFTMYKFRTLVLGADKVIGANFHSHKDGTTIPLGGFLRDLRLDELPQLFNVLKGDMNIIGPRPLRPEQYESLCKDASFEKCFTVKPGLIGYSQLFTPHATPKRLRALIESRAMSRNESWFRQVEVIGITVVSVVVKGLRRVLQRAYEQVLMLTASRGRSRRRELARVSTRGALALIDTNNDGAFECQGQVMDMNDAAFRVCCLEQIQIPCADVQLKLQIRVRRRNGASRNHHHQDGAGRTKSAWCAGQVCQVRQRARGWEYVIAYEPVTPLNHYIVQQYFLRRSVADPFSSRSIIS